MTNEGLRIRLPILEWDGNTFAIFNCRLNGKEDVPLALMVSPLSGSLEDGERFVRLANENVYQVLPAMANVAQIRTVYLLKRGLGRPVGLPDLPQITTEEWRARALDDLRSFPWLHRVFPGELVSDSDTMMK